MLILLFTFRQLGHAALMNTMNTMFTELVTVIVALHPMYLHFCF